VKTGTKNAHKTGSTETPEKQFLLKKNEVSAPTKQHQKSHAQKHF